MLILSSLHYRFCAFQVKLGTPLRLRKATVPTLHYDLLSACLLHFVQYMLSHMCSPVIVAQKFAAVGGYPRCLTQNIPPKMITYFGPISFL